MRYLCSVIQKMTNMKKKEEHIIIEKQSDDIQKEVGKWLMDIAKYVGYGCYHIRLFRQI